MSLSILGGKAKGLSLTSFVSNKTRPTSVMLRRKIFDANQSLDGFSFIDLCAGTGAMGIEAASRGAKHVTLIDDAHDVVKALISNIKLYETRTGDKNIQVVRGDGIKYLQSQICSHQLIGPLIIFFDPPYEDKNLYQKFAQEISNINIECYIWIEACTQKSMTETELFKLFPFLSKSYKQGTSYIAVGLLDNEKKLSV